MKKLTLLTLTAVLLSTMSCFADFKFGLLEAVKDASKKLDAAYVKQGGPIPKAPSNLSGIAVSISQVNLTWSDNSDNEFGFKIKRASNGSPFSTIATIDKNVTSFSDTSVSPNTTYNYRIHAYNDTGESYEDSGANTSVTTRALTITKLGTFTSAGKTFYKVSCLSNYAYILMDSAMSIVNISNTANPTQVGILSSGLSSTPKNISVSGNYAYVADGASGLIVINCSNPAAPTIAGTYTTSNASSNQGFTAVQVSGNYAYIGDNLGFEILDVSNPSSPTLIKTLAANANTIHDIFISGDYAYLANGVDGIRIENISNPSSAYQVSQFSKYSTNPNDNIIVNTKNVYKNGNYLYVTDEVWGLIIIDVSNPANPQFAGKYTNLSGYSMYDMCAKNNIAYLPDYNYGLRMISVADPENPVEAGSYTATKNCRGLCLYGNYLCAANDINGLDIYEINVSSVPVSAPAAPGNLRLSTRTKTSITIAWQDNSDNETGFDIQRKTNSGGTYTWLDTTGENSTLYTDSSGLVQGTSYYYRIRAYNSVAATFSGEIGPVILSTDPLIGKYSTYGTVYDIFISSPYAFLAAGNHGLSVLDITDPANPVIAGNYTISSNANSVHVSGNYVYVAYGYYGIEAYDITTLPTTSMSTFGNYATYGNANGVTVSGNYAYLSDSSSSNDLSIFDISDPSSLNGSSPKTYSASGSAQAIAVSGNYAYLAFDSNQGFRILNISNHSANPVLVSQTTITGACKSISVSGNYLYIGGSFGLKIYDITNPASPILVKTYTTSACDKIYVYGNYIYLAETSNGIEILDISNPALPTLVKSFTPTGGTGSYVHSIYAKGKYVYCGLSGGDLNIFDFGIVPSTSSIVPDKPINFQVAKASYTFVNLAWTDVSSNETGYRLYKSTSANSYGVIIATLAANSSTYSNTGLMPNTSYYYRLYAYNSAGNSIATDTVIGFTKAVPIVEIGSYNPSENIYHVYVTSGYAYASTSESYSFQIINISTPTNPTIVGNYTSIPPSKSFVTDKKAYVCANNLTILDVSVSSSPVLKGSAGNMSWGVDIIGNKAYSAAAPNGLQIIDISVSTNPVLLGSFITSGSACNVDVVGNYAYLATYNYGLRIIDISNPASPSETGYYDLGYSHNAFAVKVLGNYAYIAYHGNGLRIVDISNPASPTEVGSAPVSYANDVYLNGNYAYVSNVYGTLHIINIADPKNPHEVARYQGPGTNMNSVFVLGNYIYIGDTQAGLRILKTNLP
ncbi:MAG: fibronectin type III domain-containing protein [Elusimicrobia bacterium]|nr:fibronectin type III domain-containing protein [Candidatus Liberimonas magnetica]